MSLVILFPYKKALDRGQLIANMPRYNQSCTRYLSGISSACFINILENKPTAVHNSLFSHIFYAFFNLESSIIHCLATKNYINVNSQA